ncbi:type I restriction endonuclease [Helicobacter suis]|uniref:type I restriction endonuclease n=1 Tax=Helicobacter suis TaxID=104628 RepID=UPI001F080264|nr:type I restriction endonuclease [Helicobacter suis]
MLWGFLQTTQPKDIEELQKRQSTNLQETFLTRLKNQIEQQGLLKVLKEGIEVLGVSFKLAYNKPPDQKNPDTWKNYQNNLFSVTRQLRYSTQNNNSLDLVIFLNGLPIFTLAHFALDNDLVYMSTKLEGTKTLFITNTHHQINPPNL